MEIKELVEYVERWADEKGLSDPSNAIAQTLKCTEELGELAAGVLKRNDELIEDSLGDILVVLIILAKQLDKDLFKCLELAYNEIKNRSGVMKNGSFIKEADL